MSFYIKLIALALMTSKAHAFDFGVITDETQHERLEHKIVINPDDNVRVEGKRRTIVNGNLIIGVQNRTENEIAAVLQAVCPKDGSGRVYVRSNKIVDIGRLTAISENGLASSGTVVVECRDGDDLKLDLRSNDILSVGEKRTIVRPGRAKKEKFDFLVK